MASSIIVNRPPAAAAEASFAPSARPFDTDTAAPGDDKRDTDVGRRSCSSGVPLHRGSPSAFFGDVLVSPPPRGVFLSPPPPPSVDQILTRAFNINAAAHMDHHYSSGARLSSYPPTFFADGFDPFSAQRSVGQILNLLENLIDREPRGTPSRGVLPRSGYDAKEDEQALYLQVDMPGLGKEDVKVTVDHDTLVIKGGSSSTEEVESGSKYNTRIPIPSEVFKVDEIMAEMKNGVLKVVVPKVKAEKKEVVQIKVD